MEDHERSSLPGESLSKVRKMEGQSDVRSSPTATESPSPEWKLVLCHAPGRMEFHEVERFFEPIMPKDIRRGITYGTRSVVEVSFWTEAEMNQALEDCSNIGRMTSKRRSEQITLKHPEDALEEMNSTEYLWHNVPSHVLNEVLEHLSPLCWRREYIGVCKAWKNSLERAKRRSVGMFIVPDPKGINRGPDSAKSVAYERKVCQNDTNISHLVLISPGGAEEFFYWAEVVKANHRIRILTVVNQNLDDSVYFLTDNWYDAAWKNMDSITYINCSFVFEFKTDFTYAEPQEKWRLTVLVPRLDWHNNAQRADQPSTDRERAFFQLLDRSVESLNLWWPYPAEQTEWLRNCLDQLSHDNEKISHAQFNLRYRIYAYLEIGSEEISDHEEDRTGEIVFCNQFLLSKKDYAVLGHYIHQGNVPGFPPPPFEWHHASRFEIHQLPRT